MTSIAAGTTILGRSRFSDYAKSYGRCQKIQEYMLLAKEENPTKIYECIIIYYSYWKSCAVCYIVEINGYCLEIGKEQIFEIERRLRRIKNVPCEKRRSGY